MVPHAAPAAASATAMRHVSTQRALFAAALIFCLAACGQRSAGGIGPAYSYGEAWWREYEPDGRTALLLHFGPPVKSGREELAVKLEAARKEESLLEEAEAGVGKDGGLAGLLPAGPTDNGAPPDESAMPQGVVADYSPARRHLKLPEGMKIVPDGRFGSALLCSGAGALMTVVSDPRFVECWFRADRYPDRASCIFSLENDEIRLLLRPDGRLELKLGRPHGIPDPEKTPPAVAEILMKKSADIVSPQAVPTGTWTHVAVWNKPHPMPGGGEPFDARLTVNGSDAAWYLSERYNRYPFMAWRQTKFVLGNSAKGDQGFCGRIDEVRISSTVRALYERPPMPWRDDRAERKLLFDPPYFRGRGPVFRISMDDGLKYDLGDAEASLDLKGHTTDGLKTLGVRGSAWIIDPAIGFPRFPLVGMNSRRGSLEFWLRPVNWDDMTGYWHHSPPRNLNLSIMRVYAGNKRDGRQVPLFEIALPRAFNLERERIPLDPGRWTHVVAVWGGGTDKPALYLNGRRYGSLGGQSGPDEQDMDLSYAEAGIAGEAIGSDGRPLMFEIDELVGYDRPLAEDEVLQAMKRWMGPLEPIRLCDASFVFKYSLQKLEFSALPLLPEGVAPGKVSVSMKDGDGKLIAGPFSAESGGGRVHFTISEGKPIKEGSYRFEYEIRDVQGSVAASGSVPWDYREEPWRHCQAGALDVPTDPWTPVVADGRQVSTRMTRYLLADDGLPAQIWADGEPMLAEPAYFAENGTRLSGAITEMPAAKPMEARWTSEFSGKTCKIRAEFTVEFDGMMKFCLAVRPSGRAGPLALVIPIRGERARRFLYYPMGERGVRTGTVGEKDGVVFESRTAAYIGEAWREYSREKRTNAGLTWEEFWEPLRKNHRGYGFFAHLDVNDMNRGLFWFCDNAQGWVQSPDVSAIELVREGGTVRLVLNLLAEPSDSLPERPMVFALLPHPARPLPKAYRLFERVSEKQDPKACSIFDAFRPWPMCPRNNATMKVYPAPDPARPDEGPSWEYAQSCIPAMKAAKPSGHITMYLSRAWFSCRAGAYDNWEWRSGENGAVSLTPYFNNYLCWEMDQWIGRKIWDAVYLDECYETPARNIEAGFSVKLPDGTEQPGVRNFDFRELMKRWRGIFAQHNVPPMLIAHHTHSWQYAGLVFCEACLDGENSPIVSLQSRDWIDSTSKERFETLQNARLWGVATFYMPFIAEGGFENKEKSQYPRWQWRMARQAQSMFAHYETATVYEGQGSQVYRAYWKDFLEWGGGDPATCSFHPYWDNSRFLDVPGQGTDVLVSFYRKKSGGIWLIASNRKAADEVISITLKPGELGMTGAPAVKQVDSTFDPPPGEDYRGHAAVAEEARNEMEKSLGGAMEERPGQSDEDVTALLDGAEAMAERMKEKWKPRLEGNRLELPVRAKDYRVVALDW